MSLADLKPAPYNTRSISSAALAGLAASVRRFGLVQPIVWNKRSGNVVGGNQRVQALAAIGETAAQVVVVDLSETDEKALNLTLNNPHIAGEFTAGLGDILAELRIDLPPIDFEALGMWTRSRIDMIEFHGP